SEEVKKDIPTNKGKNKVLLKDKKDNERESKPKEKPEEASTSTHNKAQTYLNMKETLSLKECGTMDYGTLIIQEALISNMSETAISKRKSDPDLSQEDANKQALTLTESIIQNSKRPKEDTTVTTQQNTEVSIVPLKDEHSMIKTSQEDIYSSQWAFTRDEMEDALRGSLSDKTNIGSSTQRKIRVEKQGFSTSTRRKRPQPGSRSSSKERSKPRKSFNFGFEPKHIDKENISQTDLLQEILERLNRLEISRSKGGPVELMDMDETKLPASNLIQNTPYHYGIQSRNTNTKINNIQSKRSIHNNHNNFNDISSYQD
ncbi:9030_t:CDS:2, partial [Gigaspora rosea]